MFRRAIMAGAVLALTSAAQAQVPTGWKIMLTTGATPGEPQGAYAYPSLPPGAIEPSLTPSLLNDPIGPAISDTNGTTYLYLLNTGAGQDNTGTNWSHLEAEGGSFGAFQGQFWYRWTGLLTSLKTTADTAIGADKWTIRRMWVGVAPSSIGVGCNGGLVSLAEVTSLGTKGGVANWGDKTQLNTEDGGNLITQLPAGYNGFFMGPTQATACFTAMGTAAGQSAINPDFYKVLDLTGGPQVLPTGTLSFQQLVSGMNSRVRPVQDDFALYMAPIDDFNGGQGWTTGISYQGFPTSTTFGGFDPYLLFELVKQPALTGPTPPIANDLTAEAPFSASPGSTCAASITASDVDLGDTLTFTITNPGTLGGTITPAGPVAGTNLGGGNWRLNITYNIPANARGIDQFSYSVSDGTNTSFGVIKYNIRGPSSKNSVAFGANSGNVLDTMRIYTGASVPDGGTTGTLDEALSPQDSFPQSTEYDNAGGIRHNPAGTILAVSFGPAPNGPGVLTAYRGTPTCDTVGGRIVFSFAPPSVMTGPARTVGLSVSPDNTKLAVFSPNQQILYVLNYNAAVFPPTVTLNKEVDLSLIFATNPTVGTTWLDNNNVLILDSDANLHKIQVFPATVVSGIPLCDNPRLPLPGTISSADIEYNPEISPYIYVAVGTFAGGASNTIYVCDTAGNIISQDMGQLYTAYDDGLAETFREVAFDCFGNLYIGTFVDNSALVNVKYLPNAKNVAGIVGGDSSLVTWRTLQIGEGSSNFSGMDTAAGTTIGGGGTCANASPAASFVNDRTAVNNGATVTLRCTDDNLGDTISFMVIGTFGSAGGTLTPFGAITTTGTERTQQAVYTPVLGFRGVECFSYKAVDNGTPPLQNSSNVTGVCIDVRGDAMAGTVAFGGDLFDQNQTLRLYYGQHVANGGTNAVEDVATGRSFASATEFDNYAGTAHNPAGNLFSTRTGSATGGGMLYVYPTKAAVNGQPATIIYRWDGLTGGDLDRVSGLSISPDNTKLAVYGFDTKKIYFLNYTPGLVGDIGFGGTLAASVAANTQVDVSSVATVANRSTGTAFLNNSTVLWVNGDTGDLYTVDTSGTLTLRTTCPRTINNLSTADVDYDPVSGRVYVTVGEFLSPTTTNTLYIVNSATWAIVNQSGGATYTNHSAAGTGTFRENGLSSGNKLFICTFADASNSVNIRYVDVSSPAAITDNSSVIWNTMDVGQTLTGFSGMDVASGVPATCAVPGDTNGDGQKNGKDIQLFTQCYLAALNAAPPMAPPGCVCADVATPYKALNSADLAAFVALLLAP